MKHLFFLFLTVSFLSASAQQTIRVTEAFNPMSRNMQPSFQVEIPQASLKQVYSNWLKFLGSWSREKASLLNGENHQSGVVYVNISATPFRVYSKLLETPTGVRLTAWFTENDTLFFSSAQDTGRAMEIQLYLHEFALREYREAVRSELSREQSVLGRLTSELERLLKTEEASLKEISEDQRSILKTRDAILTNDADIKILTMKIQDQKGNVDNNAADPNAMKGAKKTLRELENDKRRLQRQNESHHKNIDTWDKDIREALRSVTDTRNRQTVKMAEIDLQHQRVQEVQSHLDGIR